MNKVLLKDVAKIDVSNVDKKSKDGEQAVRLCNFVDVYKHWRITPDLTSTFMVATAPQKHIDKFTIHKGQVAITKDSETRDDIGVSTYIAEDMPNILLGYHCILITPNEESLSGEYLNLVMQSKYANKYFEANASGSGQRYTLTNDIVGNMPIPIVELWYQKRLGTIFAYIDEKIKNNNKIIGVAEKLMREIYDYWFVQFNFPDNNGHPYKSSGGEMVYDEKLKREIPKGWKVQNLLKNDLCKDIKPGIDKFDDIKTYYATADVIDGEMGIGTQIDYDDRESRANMQPKPNSVWFAKMKNSVKHITVMPTSNDLLEESVFSTGFFGLKCGPETLSYIRSFIYSDYFEKVKDLNSNGATMEAISNDGVKYVKLIVPDGITLKKYSNITNACLTQNDILRKENAKLISFRDWLLPMLMSGQVKIAD